MKNEKILATLAVVFTVLIWGLSFLSIKVTLAVIPPMTLGLLRFLIATFLLSIITRIKEPQLKLNKEDIPMMALAGFVGVTLYFYFENNGIKLMPVSTASIVIATIPIFTLIFESIIYKIKLTRKKILSVFISFIGVLFIVGMDFKHLITSDIGMGYLMMFGAVFAWTIYSLTTKSLFKKYSQIGIIYYQSIFGTILFIPFSLFEATKWNQVTGTMVLNVLYLGVFCSAIGYCTYAFAMKHLGVSNSSLYLNVMPIVTLIASFFILGEKIVINQVLGGVLIIISVFLANKEETITKPKNEEMNLENIRVDAIS